VKKRERERERKIKFAMMNILACDGGGVKLIYLRLLLLEEVAELRGDYVSIISSD
jgi:hypothetical protein